MDVSGQLHTPAAPPQGKDTGTRWIIEWAGLRAGPDGFGDKEAFVYSYKKNNKLFPIIFGRDKKFGA